jgi:hypothetical protein
MDSFPVRQVLPAERSVAGTGVVPHRRATTRLPSRLTVGLE